MPQAIYMDSQCMAYLLGQPVLSSSKGWTASGTQVLRQAVDRALADGTVVLYGSHFHLEEASRIPDDDARRRSSTSSGRRRSGTFCYRLTTLLSRRRGGVMRWRATTHLRSTGGAKNSAGSRRRNQILMRSPRASRRCRQGCSGLCGATCVAEKKLALAYANLTPAAVSKRWWDDAQTTIEDWVKDYLAASKEHLLAWCRRGEVAEAD